MVLDAETGDMLEHRHLMRHSNPKIKQTYTTSAADELDRLIQGVGQGDQDG